jgi:hypothetical protein
MICPKLSSIQPINGDYQLFKVECLQEKCQCWVKEHTYSIVGTHPMAPKQRTIPGDCGLKD